MSARNRSRMRRAVVAALALGLGGTAALVAPPLAGAQQVASAPLSQVDPWGLGRLGGADSVSPQIWGNSDAERLAQVIDGLKPSALSPAAQSALARLMLSSTRPPPGGFDAQPARLRLLEQLGETDFALDIRRASPGSDWGKDSDLRAAQHELATLRASTACRRASERPASDPAWLPVRALCLALAGDFDTAALAAEQTLTGDGAKDPWLLAAIETIRTPGRTKPGGRYATPFEIAVSLSAGLGVPRGALDGLAPDLALAVLRHPSATPEHKRAALGPLLAAGRLTAQDLPAFEAPPAGRAATGATPAAVLLAQAEAAARATSATDAAKATAYAAALKAAANAGEFQLAALTLLPRLKDLARTPETAVHAETLARAAIAAGDLELAARWREMLNVEGADVWARARIDYLLGLAGAPGIDPTRALADLSGVLAPIPAETAAPAARPGARPAAPTQDEIRRIESTRILFLHAGLGRPTPPAARALIGSQRAVGRGVSDAGLLRATTALEAGAPGEAALVALSLLTNDPSAQSFAGIADLLMVLRQAGLGREAEGIALESLQVWKAF